MHHYCPTLLQHNLKKKEEVSTLPSAILQKKTQFSINSNKIKIHDICTNTCDMFSLMSGSCHLDRASNNEFSVECLF